MPSNQNGSNTKTTKFAANKVKNRMEGAQIQSGDSSSGEENSTHGESFDSFGYLKQSVKTDKCADHSAASTLVKRTSADVSNTKQLTINRTFLIKPDDEIKLREYQKCVRSAHIKILGNIVQSGQRLYEAHDLLAHYGDGHFEHWVKADCGISVTSARNYMKVAMLFKDYEDSTSLFERCTLEALYLLAGLNNRNVLIEWILKNRGKREKLTKADILKARISKNPTASPLIAHAPAESGKALTQAGKLLVELSDPRDDIECPERPRANTSISSDSIEGFCLAMENVFREFTKRRSREELRQIAAVYRDFAKQAEKLEMSAK